MPAVAVPVAADASGGTRTAHAHPPYRLFINAEPEALQPGQVAGRLSHHQSAWLRQELTSPAGAGSVVVLHHPPISLSPQQAAAGLQDPSALAWVLEGTDVHLVSCGHLHAQLSGRWPARPSGSAQVSSPAST